ncbi:MAG: DUF3131 domain-containing protein [Gemmatimonadota bacterium]
MNCATGLRYGLRDGTARRDCATGLRYGTARRDCATGLRDGTALRDCATGLRDGTARRDGATGLRYGTALRDGATGLRDGTALRDGATGLRDGTALREGATGLRGKTAPSRVELENENAFFAAAATAAFKQFNGLWRPKTGLAAATPAYEKLTPWDIGSVLAANFSAHRLGLLADEEYAKRMAATLRTLKTMPLYRRAVFHKMYFSNTGRMVSRRGGVTTVGYGWSATDLGRLLNWLRIIAENEPRFRAAAERVARRIEFSETVKDGYMWGGLLGTRGKLWRFQEGRIGYEQYAAAGYDYWGARVHNALDLQKHARPTQVLGVPLLADTRGLDRLNSEPFILMGMELGFTPGMEELAHNVLAAQKARYDQTGKLTMVSEDAVSIPPYYFYYYCVLCNGRAFTVDVAETGKHLDGPRWLSTKAAFGYHALFGTAYTRRVLETVAQARTGRGWSSGVFEGSHEPTNTHDVNTAAIVLEAALYRELGRPLLEAGRAR